jgi:hypothetical protein
VKISFRCSRNVGDRAISSKRVSKRGGSDLRLPRILRSSEFLSVRSTTCYPTDQRRPTRCSPSLNLCRQIHGHPFQRRKIHHGLGDAGRSLGLRRHWFCTWRGWDTRVSCSPGTRWRARTRTRTRAGAGSSPGAVTTSASAASSVRAATVIHGAGHHGRARSRQQSLAQSANRRVSDRTIQLRHQSAAVARLPCPSVNSGEQ